MLCVTRQAWCLDAEQALEGDASRGDLSFIRDEVQRGISMLWRITGDSDGWVVTRQETHYREIVIVAGVGRNCRAAIIHFTHLALKNGFTVRTHIVRAGLQRIYERLGFTMREIVMEAGSDGQ